MAKLMWVALPLFGALAWLVLAWLRRGRPPARRSVHMAGSVLLMIYLAATAGLGIFWVANQQLPVFDWHYLFGYTTLLLVALHLWFNLPRLWRWWMQRSGEQPPTPDTARPSAPRRPLLAALGVGALTAAAFAFGLRQGRRERDAQNAQVMPQQGAAGEKPSATGRTVAGDMALVERFQAESSTSRTGVLQRLPGGNWGTAPPPFKSYPGEALALRAPQPAPAPQAENVDATTIGTLLWHTAGITARRVGIALRASPSSGALFSTELYLAVRAAEGVAPGWWHYDVPSHALRRLSTPGAPAPDDDALGSPGEPLLRGAPVVVLATAVFGRTGHKYRDRTYRYVLADLGHALENLRVAADATGLAAALLPRFDDRSAATALGLDLEREGLLAIVALRRRGDVAAPTAAPEVQPGSPRWYPAALAEAASVELDVTAAMHRASSLRVSAAAGDARASVALGPDSASAGAAAPPPRSGHGLLLPAAPPAMTRRNALDVIARRRSLRRFTTTPLPLSALAAVLQAMRGVPPVLSHAVRIQLVVHAVEGMPSGAYRFVDAPHGLEPRGPRADLRDRSRAAALDQDVIGDAAVVFVLSIDRAQLAGDPLGSPRAYRHAMLEAGLIGERIYLEGCARGLGVCAVGAFFDDEAAALVGVDTSREWVVHFAALGVPQS